MNCSCCRVAFEIIEATISRINEVASDFCPDRRSPDWIKIKSRPQQEFVVYGFTECKRSRKHFGALLIAAYRKR